VFPAIHEAAVSCGVGETPRCRASAYWLVAFCADCRVDLRRVTFEEVGESVPIPHLDLPLFSAFGCRLCKKAVGHQKAAVALVPASSIDKLPDGLKIDGRRPTLHLDGGADAVTHGDDVRPLVEAPDAFDLFKAHEREELGDGHLELEPVETSLFEAWRG
jgi:hypothetical protein